MLKVIGLYDVFRNLIRFCTLFVIILSILFIVIVCFPFPPQNCTAQAYKPSEQFEVFKWLRDHGIEYYFTNFIRSNYNSLNELTRMELTAEVLHELEIQLPGHRKRLQQACKSNTFYFVTILLSKRSFVHIAHLCPQTWICDCRL